MSEKDKEEFTLNNYRNSYVKFLKKENRHLLNLLRLNLKMENR